MWRTQSREHVVKSISYHTKKCIYDTLKSKNVLCAIKKIDKFFVEPKTARTLFERIRFDIDFRCFRRVKNRPRRIFSRVKTAIRFLSTR